MKALILSVILIPILSFASTDPKAGFQSGNDIKVHEIRGTVHYTCLFHGKYEYRTWHCGANLFSPGSHDYVVTKSEVDADKITLTATRADGSKKSKSVNFNSEKSASSSRVNLMIKTLTQSPLLKIGENNINVEFKKKNKVVAQSNFKSNVQFTGTSLCRNRSVHTSSYNYCRDQLAGCDHYFWLENECQY
jgi:hypothetical protein